MSDTLLTVHDETTSSTTSNNDNTSSLASSLDDSNTQQSPLTTPILHPIDILHDDPNNPNLPYQPLEYKWNFYYSLDSSDNWQPMPIGTFNTVYQFWCIYNNIVTPTYLPFEAKYLVFKDGISPDWQADIHKNGGQLMLQLVPLELGHDVIDDCWLHTLLALIGEYFTSSHLITGTLCVVRNNYIRISLWLSHGITDDHKKSLINEWKKCLQTTHPIKFKAFD